MYIVQSLQCCHILYHLDIPTITPVGHPGESLITRGPPLSPIVKTKMGFSCELLIFCEPKSKIVTVFTLFQEQITPFALTCIPYVKSDRNKLLMITL